MTRLNLSAALALIALTFVSAGTATAQSFFWHTPQTGGSYPKWADVPLVPGKVYFDVGLGYFTFQKAMPPSPQWHLTEGRLKVYTKDSAGTWTLRLTMTSAATGQRTYTNSIEEDVTWSDPQVLAQNKTRFDKGVQVKLVVEADITNGTNTNTQTYLVQYVTATP